MPETIVGVDELVKISLLCHIAPSFRLLRPSAVALFYGELPLRLCSVVVFWEINRILRTIYRSVSELVGGCYATSIVSHRHPELSV